MSTLDRITVTLPGSLVEEIDREAPNRSRFVQTAIEHELERLRRERLQESIHTYHGESEAVGDEGFADWIAEADPADEELLDPASGSAVRWESGSGWQKR